LLVLDVFEVARRAFECRKPPGARPSLHRPPPPAHGRERSGRTDQPSQGEGTGALPSALAGHPRDLTIRSTVLVCTLGDLTLDVIVRLAGPIARGGDTNARIELRAGGQAANVSAWAAALGARARFVGKTGSDDAGELARARLAAYGVRVVGPVEGRTGAICALVSREGERSMAADRGAAAELGPDELEPAWFADCEHLHVSGYALFREPARSAARRAVELARAAGAVVSVDLASWSGIRDAGAETMRGLVLSLAPEIVFANEAEERAIGGSSPGAVWIVKRGARGCSFDGGERPALPVERVVDTTGAGDALAAGWIVGGPDLALDAAARCVRQAGGMPTRGPST